VRAVLRPPSFSRGFTSFLWAFTFGLLLFVLLIGVGVGSGSAFLFALVAGGLIFFYVRLFGGDEFRPRGRG
jgi:hypothetical protein